MIDYDYFLPYITEGVFSSYFLGVLTFCSIFIWLSESGRFAIAVYTWPELFNFST